MGRRAGGKGGRAGAQCWGTEELVAKTGYLVCDLSTVPDSFNTSPRFSQTTASCTRTRHAKCRAIKAQNHLGFCAQRGLKASVGQWSPGGNTSNDVEGLDLTLCPFHDLEGGQILHLGGRVDCFKSPRTLRSKHNVKTLILSVNTKYSLQ